jgi:hypothetical protein
LQNELESLITDVMGKETGPFALRTKEIDMSDVDGPSAKKIPITFVPLVILALELIFSASVYVLLRDLGCCATDWSIERDRVCLLFFLADQ